MSPLAQLRAEIGDTLLRIETIAKHVGLTQGPHAGYVANKSYWWLRKLNELVGAALVKELEQSKQPSKEVQP